MRGARCPTNPTGNGQSHPTSSARAAGSRSAVPQRYVPCSWTARPPWGQSRLRSSGGSLASRNPRGP
eukprot:1242530-Alexandrium_andersonii.AAC.1